MDYWFKMFFYDVQATETAQQLKKTAGVPFHSKGRGPAKKFDTTSACACLLLFFFFQIPANVTRFIPSSSQRDSQGPVPEPHGPQHVQPPQQPHPHCPSADATAQGERSQGDPAVPLCQPARLWTLTLLFCPAVGHFRAGHGWSGQRSEEETKDYR